MTLHSNMKRLSRYSFVFYKVNNMSHNVCRVKNMNNVPAQNHLIGLISSRRNYSLMPIQTRLTSLWHHPAFYLISSPLGLASTSGHREQVAAPELAWGYPTLDGLLLVSTLESGIIAPPPVCHGTSSCNVTNTNVTDRAGWVWGWRLSAKTGRHSVALRVLAEYGAPQSLTEHPSQMSDSVNWF